MSVYQVEEYYVCVDVPEDRIHDVKLAIESCEECHGMDVQWSDNTVTVDGFELEDYAMEVSRIIYDAI